MNHQNLLIAAFGFLSQAIKENNINFQDLFLEESKIFYFPKMNCLHREMWEEEQLFIFLPLEKNIKDIAYCKERRGKIFVSSIDPINIIQELKNQFAYNLCFDPKDIPLSAMPALHEYEIDSQDILNLFKSSSHA